MKSALSLIAVAGLVFTMAALPAAGQERPAKPADGVTMPRVVKDVKPAYTASAMQQGIQGNVVLEAVVKEDGSVGDVKVTKSLDTKHGLDEEAVKAMKRWEFTPGTKDGKPLAVAVEVEMTFTLKK